jgi:flagellar biosynthesis/type III secretory pathway protein FliH
MTEKTREKELDELKADIASLREEIAALATGVKKFAETKAAEPHAEGEHETTQQGSPAKSEQGPGVWTDFQHTLDEAWARNEKIIKDLAAEIERHPLVGSMAAFGLGFIIAKLWHRGSKQ